jgi:hypothetical protein
MPDNSDDSDKSDEHIVLKVQAPPKVRPAAGRQRPPSPQTDPQDMIAGLAVMAALIFAVATVSGWIPLDRYTIGIVAGCAALAAAAKLVKARRSVTGLPRQRR